MKDDKDIFDKVLSSTEADKFNYEYASYLEVCQKFHKLKQSESAELAFSLLDEPILVGKLNKEFGYNGFEPIKIGTNVYSHRDVYFFEMTPIIGVKNVIQKFYKETLTPCINFFDNE